MPEFSQFIVSSSLFFESFDWVYMLATAHILPLLTVPSPIQVPFIGVWRRLFEAISDGSLVMWSVLFFS